MSVTVTVVIVVGACLLFILLLAQYLGGFGDGDDANDDLPLPSFEERIERLIGLLNYGDPKTAEDASRRLLSMGPGILPVIFAHLQRLEQNPSAVSPQCQLMLEAVLVDFGLQTLLQTADALGQVHRSSPAFPAIVRVLVGIGPNVLSELARNPDPPSALVVPLMPRFEDRGQRALAELLEAHPESVPEILIEAALIQCSKTSGALEQLWSGLPDSGRDQISRVLWPWWPANRPLPVRWHEAPDPWLASSGALREIGGEAQTDVIKACIGFGLEADEPARQISAHLLDALSASDALALFEDSVWATLGRDTDKALLEALGDGRDESDARPTVERALSFVDAEAVDKRRAGIRALEALIEDPRAVERLVLLAEDTGDRLGGLALVILARAGLGPLEGLLTARVRGAILEPEALVWLHLVSVWMGPNGVSVLLGLLRSESPRAVSLAARLLAPRELPVEPLLKALGRHRYSTLEGLVAPLIWARWPEVRGELGRLMASDDREICRAAIELTGSLGEREHGEALLGMLRTETEVGDPAFNAVEMLGPDMIPALEALRERQPEVFLEHGVQRRLSLLEALRDRDGSE